MKPGNENADQFPRNLRAILTAEESGVRFGDNVGPVVTFSYDDGETFDVQTTLRARPASVQVLLARNATTLGDGYESGCRVRWSWRGEGVVRVHAIDVSDTSDTYEVTLGMWRI